MLLDKIDGARMGKRNMKEKNMSKATLKNPWVAWGTSKSSRIDTNRWNGSRIDTFDRVLINYVNLDHLIPIMPWKLCCTN